jgi:hypothetical protein
MLKSTLSRGPLGFDDGVISIDAMVVNATACV